MNRNWVLYCALTALVLISMGQGYCVASEESENLFSNVEAVRPHDLTPLEAQIQELELELQNHGRSMPLEETEYMRVKQQLAELYEQLPREHNPLDDGANACPAVDIPSNIQPWTDYGTTVGATNNFSSFSPCGASTAPDKIYRFTPANSGYYTFDTFGSDFDTQLYIRSGGACPGTTALICNDDFGGSQSKVQWLMNAGQAYYIIVDGFQNYSGNFVLHLTVECNIGNSPQWQQECAESVGDPFHAAWDCNGGCNNQFNGGFPQWQQLNLCQFQRGECFTYIDQNNFTARDIDTYSFTLTEPCSLMISTFSTFSYNVLILDYGFCLPNLYYSQLNIPSCNGGTFITQCLPAGTYAFEISPNFFEGMTTPQPYVFQLDPIPCSGCRIDASVIAPASFSANGCGVGSQNSLRPSDEATYCVVIPFASDWTFDLCGTGPQWNSYLYLTSECSGGIIAQDNDGCSPGGHARIECVSLLPGNYYLTIEGFNIDDCASFYMNITPCTGSCCYGNDPFNLQCAFVSQSECAQMAGEFTLGQQCTPDVCGIRPECDMSSQYSQQPHLPTETWTALATDTYLPNRVWEDYSASGVISGVRFWGVSLDYNTGLACTEQPGSFQITFVDSSYGPTVQSYNMNITGGLLPQNYGANYPMYEYYADLPTDCGILSGRINIAGSDGDPCVFHWLTSPQGNGNVVLVNSGGSTLLSRDMAVCLNEGCPKPDSVVIRLAAPDTYDVLFHLPENSYVRLYYSDNVNAVFPNTYVELTAGSLNAGNWMYTDNTAIAQRRYLLTAQCGPPPILAVNSGAFHLTE
ncbi:MAG: hypothetical protein KDB65_09995 [Calditrichaeota bacterium]|nr:hypothetical protein [Calditrichota bacterium]MCB9369524.1 hypothetical protein [Calditrichota bacterium]